jgi:L-amino acid N-acyltransferase YncA
MGTTEGRRLRRATEDDGAACAAIYAPYVTDTAISFETEPPSPAEMAVRIEAASRRHAWIVLQDAESVIGYAYGLPFRPRAAYSRTCEVSVYMETGRRRTGGGSTLYTALLARLAERGFHLAVAGMTLPNDASVALHRALGFEPVGVYRQVGFKHGRWHDVAWVQRLLGPETRSWWFKRG